MHLHANELNMHMLNLVYTIPVLITHDCCPVCLHVYLSFKIKIHQLLYEVYKQTYQFLLTMSNNCHLKYLMVQVHISGHL